MLRLLKHTIQVASISPYDYIVVMIAKSEKQTTFFSNLGNILCREVRYTANNAKQENSFYKLSSDTLQLEHRGNWMPVYDNKTGNNFGSKFTSFNYSPNAHITSAVSNTPIIETHETLANHEGALHPNELHKTSAQYNKQLRGSNTATSVEPTELNVYLNLTNDVYTLLFNPPIASTKPEFHNLVDQQVDDQQVPTYNVPHVIAMSV